MLIFSAAQCALTWGTKDLLAGCTRLENAIVVDFPVALWATVPGCDGESVRVRTKHHPGTVRVNVDVSTPLHRDLLTALVADATTGVVVAPLMLTNKETGANYAAPIAYLTGAPSQGLSGDATWEFTCPLLSPVPTPGLSTGLPSPV